MKTQIVQLNHGTESGANRSSGGAFASIASALQQDRSRYGCWDSRRFIGGEPEASSLVDVANDMAFLSSPDMRLVANC